MSNLADLDLGQLTKALSDKDISAPELMQACLDRIAACNPSVNAIVNLRPHDDLMAEAANAQSDTPKGPLHGIPIAVKDLVDTKGIRSTHGSPIFKDFIPRTDDLLASRLKDAGAIIIGKTNTPEFGIGSHTYNPVHGPTCNPYDLSKSAGGSSGGAAAALATGMMAVADGSDMMGSLRNPAAYCNVYGFRPSFGLVPREPGGETFAHQISTAGPMARSVEDLAVLLDVLSAPEPRVPHNLAHAAPFAGNLQADIKGKRIGWLADWDGYLPVEPEILDLCSAGLRVFEELGAEVEPVRIPFDPAEIWASWTTLRHWAISGNLGAHYTDPAQRDLLKPEAIWEIEGGLALSALDIHKASVTRSRWFACLAEMFQRYDALVLPSAQLFPFDVTLPWPSEVAGRRMDTYHRWMEVVVPASLAGIPALSVPVGFGAAGLPMGMQLLGRHGNDANILTLGAAYHDATKWPGRGKLDPKATA
ncbi:MAG: amidase [Paracoccaceae bacterium]